LLQSQRLAGFSFLNLPISKHSHPLSLRCRVCRRAGNLGPGSSCLGKIWGTGQPLRSSARRLRWSLEPLVFPSTCQPSLNPFASFFTLQLLHCFHIYALSPGPTSSSRSPRVRRHNRLGDNESRLQLPSDLHYLARCKRGTGQKPRG
jgi:hypothetical protein